MPLPDLYNDKELFGRIAQGDETAFAALFRSYFGILQPFILRLSHSAADTEEILQETFIRLWMNRDKLTDIQNPQAWIYTIASNECYKHLRQKTTRQVGLDSLENSAKGGEGDLSTIHSIQINEVNRLVAAAVRQLPFRRRRIYLMSRGGGMTIPEIAGELRISPHTVKNALVSALRFIRTYLAARGHEL